MMRGRKIAEEARLREDALRKKNWKRWGPYLSERQWGTVREDYSPSGNPWEYFPHDHARSRAYRWGEDGFYYDHLHVDGQFLPLKLRSLVGLIPLIAAEAIEDEVTGLYRSSSRAGRTAGHATEAPGSTPRTRTGATWFFSTNISTGTRVAGSGQATRPDGPPWW